MKGIILAGGRGTRLYPLSKVISKQLLPVYDKPMIYYPLSILMLAGIVEILIISTPDDLPRFESLLGDGSRYGLSISYAAQSEPRGLPDAFVIGADFIGSENVCLILGDNILYGHDLISLLVAAVNDVEANGGAKIFGYHVNDPEHYGVIEHDGRGTPISVQEKPRNSRSNIAIVGLYFFDKNVVNVSRSLKPSKRGETEITDVIKTYLRNGSLRSEILYRGIAWLDAGSHDSRLEASHFISIVEKRHGLKIACLEEIAYRRGLISKQELTELASELSASSYGQYLTRVIDEI